MGKSHVFIRRLLFLLIVTTGLFAGQKLELGSSQSIINSVEKQRARGSSELRLTSSSSEELLLKIRDYYFEDGKLSITGKASKEINREFILKGNEKNIYGWVVDYDKNVAYEYRTDSNSNVVVEQVPVTKIYPICNINPREVAGEPQNYKPRWTSGSEPHIGEYNGQNVNKLESQPGCKKVFYLDISDIMNGDNPKTAHPDNLKTKAEVYKLWQSVSAGFSNFQMNVTTNPKVYKDAGIPNSGIAKFWDADGRSNSPLNAFGTTNASTNYRNTGQGYGIGRTAFHEIGHTMGMSHDGGSNQTDPEYFEGLSDYQWCPIMGNYWFANSWPEALFQWSLGEYTSATCKEDDLSRVNRYVEYCEDDIVGSTPLIIVGDAINPEDNRGQISKTGETDSFIFTIGAGGGHLTLHGDRTEYIGGAMLDVALSLEDGDGNEIAFSNPEKVRYADLDEDLSAGDYTLIVKGGAEGTPGHGFSNYSSLGYYAMEGTITGVSNDPSIIISSPTINDSYEQGNSCEIRWFDNIDNDVKISLIKGGTFIKDIKSAVASDGLYIWDIESNITAGENYRIVIASTSDKSIVDTSEFFSVTEEYVISNFPYLEDFDTLTEETEILPLGWEQESNDDINWTVWTGATPSKIGAEPNVTGPDGDYPNNSGNFIYVEASDPNNPGKTASIVTPKFRIWDNYRLDFKCHMFSDSGQMGRLKLDVLVDGKEYSEIITLSNDSGDQWFGVSQDLSSYQGDRVRFRFGAVTGESWASDICIDYVSIDKPVSVIGLKSIATSFTLSKVGNSIKYFIPKNMNSKNLDISLYNLKGAYIKNLQKGVAISGSHVIDAGLKSISAGYYICKITVGSNQLIVPMIKTN